MAHPTTIRIARVACAGFCLVGIGGYGLGVARGDAVPLLWPALCTIGGATLLLLIRSGLAAASRPQLMAYTAVSAIGIAATLAWPLQRWMHGQWTEQQKQIDAIDAHIEEMESRQAEQRIEHPGLGDTAVLEAQSEVLVRTVIDDFNALDDNELRSVYIASLMENGSPYEVRLARQILARTDDPRLVAGLLIMLRDITGKPLEADAVAFAATPTADRSRILRSLDDWLWTVDQQVD